MNLTTFLQGLANTLLQGAESVGGALLAAFGQIFLQFTSDERSIMLKVKQKWLDTYNAAVAAKASEVDAIEQASTAAYNEFCSDESDEFNKVKSGVIANLEYAAKSTAGLLKTATGAA
jgi:hypothetical protein